MGGGSTLPDQETKKHEMNVLVTGFGPFPRQDGGQYTRNASHEITRLLPTTLPAHSTFNPSKTPINILNPTAADDCYIPTEYAAIRTRTKALHAEYAGKADLILHLGQADGWHVVTVERLAFKPGFSSTWWSGREEEKYYTLRDNKGENIDDLDPEGKHWEGVPVGLGTQVRVDAVVEGANERLGKMHRHVVDEEDEDEDEDEDRNWDVVVEKSGAGKHKNQKPMRVVEHLEPGSYGCGFIYYESLANCFVQMRRRDVLFCHVAAETDEESLKRGRDAICAVIGSAVAWMVKSDQTGARDWKERALGIDPTGIREGERGYGVI